MRSLSPLLLTALLLPTGCGDSAEAGEARKQINEALDAAETYSRAEIESMTSELKNRWTELEADLAKLKEEADARGERTKADFQKAIADLEAEAKEASRKLDSIAEAGSTDASEALVHLQEAFNSAKTAVQKAWRELDR